MAKLVPYLALREQLSDFWVALQQFARIEEIKNFSFLLMGESNLLKKKALASQLKSTPPDGKTCCHTSDNKCCRGETTLFRVMFFLFLASLLPISLFIKVFRMGSISGVLFK